MIVITLLFLVPYFVICRAGNEQLKIMETEEIVPDIIPTLPAYSIKLTFGPKEVSFGNELTPTDVAEMPTVEWTFEKDTYYTFVMIDPDVPNRESKSQNQVIHWLITNVMEDDTVRGQTVVTYLSSGPAKDSGLHRYIFLVYKQSGYLSFNEPKIKRLSRAPRLDFNLKEFVEKYNFGDPICGNFYVAKWDTYCDELDKLITE